jgi:tetratricopeptide (TPR) repeat protein/transcriptional regulator with XRE-family HTH domain
MAGVEPQTFGLLLSHYRRAAGLTQEELAERAGMSARGVADLERGARTRPRVSTVRLLADGLALTSRDRAIFQHAAERPLIPAPDAEDALLLPSHTVHRPRGREIAIPMIGRIDELRGLDEHLCCVGPPVLLLSGEPGIGKTRLLQETRETAGQRKWTVVWGGCQRSSGEEPYAPLVGALSNALQRLPSLEDAVVDCAWIVRLLPELLSVISEPLPSLAAAQERRLVFDAVGRFLRNIGGPSGTLLILDDLQWARGDTFDLLDALARRHEELELRMIGAYRNTEVSHNHPLATWRGDFTHAQLGADVTLGPLSQVEAAELLATSLRGTRGHTSEVGREIAERTGGVPFFVLSYARTLDSNDGGLVAADAIPSTVVETIRQRVAVLPDQGRAVLAAAAIIGRVVPSSLLIDVVALPEEEISGALEAVCQAQLMADDGKRGYRFVHDLIREVVEDDLGPVRRSLLHRAVAEEQEHRPGRHRHTAELAWHFLQAGDTVRALSYSLQAGDAAYAAFANREAEPHYRTAVELARELEDREQEAGVLRRLGLAIRRQGRTDESSEILLAAASRYEALEDFEGAMGALSDFEIHTALALRQRFVSHLLRVLDHASSEPSSSQVQAYASLSDLLWMTGNMAESVAMAERAVALAESVRDPWARTHALHALSKGLFQTGRQKEAAEVTERGISSAEEAGDLQRLAVLLMNWAVFAHERGDWAAAEPVFHRALQLSRQIDDRFRIVLVLGDLGDFWFLRGDWAKAEGYFREALTVEQTISTPIHIAEVLLAHLNLQQGDEAARGVLERLAREEGHWAHQCLAEWEIITGQPERARDRLRATLANGIEGQHEMDWKVSLAKALLASADLESASTLIEVVLANPASCALRQYAVNALQVLGMVRTAQSRWEEAGAALQEALELACDLRWHRPRVLHELGIMYAAKGEVSEARSCFEEALAMFQELGAKPHVERTKRVLTTLSTGL